MNILDLIDPDKKLNFDQIVNILKQNNVNYRYFHDENNNDIISCILIFNGNESIIVKIIQPYIGYIKTIYSKYIPESDILDFESIYKNKVSEIEKFCRERDKLVDDYNRKIQKSSKHLIKYLSKEM